MAGGNNDDPFECVLRNTANIDTFVDEFFSFLARRTDFFLECPPEGGSYGFPKGHAEKIIMTKFHKWKPFRPESMKCDPALVPMSPNTSSSSTKNNIPAVKDIATDDSKKISTVAPVNTSSYENHNGNATDKYTWTQTITDLDVKVPIKVDVKKGKDVNVEIRNNSIFVALTSSLNNPIIDAKLAFPVVKDESYWNLFPGESIHIWLQKSKERWWTALLEGEDPIDMKSIEAVRPMEELNEEEQMKIQELMWNQERKQQGLHTSDELKMLNTLEKAWNLEGSPFKGQPFDPSVINTNNMPSNM